MNPILASPHSPNLVTVLMDEREREAAEMRLAAELPPTAEMDSPHRFRRFLIAARPRLRHVPSVLHTR